MSRGAIAFVAVAALATGCASSDAADKDTFEKKVKEKLPEGYTGLRVGPPNKIGDISVEVTYSYPGMEVEFSAWSGPRGYPQEPKGVYLVVKPAKPGDVLARFEYAADGKLKVKKAEAVSEAAWPWVQEMAAKVAAATFAAK